MPQAATHGNTPARETPARGTGRAAKIFLVFCPAPCTLALRPTRNGRTPRSNVHELGR